MSSKIDKDIIFFRRSNIDNKLMAFSIYNDICEKSINKLQEENYNKDIIDTLKKALEFF